LGTGDAAGSSSRGAAPLGALVVDQRHPALIAWRAGRTVRAEWCDDSDQACCADTSHALARTRSRMPSGPAVAVPLVARGETVGVLTLVDAEGCRPLEAEDEQILADVGRRVGAALDNLRLLAIRTRVAARLQESLLPQRLPAVSQAELAVRYLTGDDGADVGGDFYDAFPLGADEYAFVIGDVSGRGADAAGLTGLARATLRALDASVGPAGALARLNELLIGRSDGERFLTAAYLRIGPRTETGATATVCLAGHPRPVVVGPTGAIRWVGTPGTLLGVFDQPPLTDQTVRLSPGDTVLLYTDGVIEAKGPEGLFGEDRLAAVLAPLAGRSAEDVVTDIERAILEYRDSASDDTALLALRLLSPRESGQRVLADLHLSADPSTAKAARHAVAGLGGRAFPRELTDDLLLAVSELVTNAIRQLERQPTRTLRSDPIQLRVLQRPGMLRVEIHNPGSTFSLPVNLSVPDPTTERGRGLVVVRALSNRMGVDTSSGATCVWFEIDVPAGTALDGTTCRGQHLPGQAARHAWGPTPSP
ncbi:MAG: SpoIIE family protein phosphatase, partial [Dactylosporangium sp.]|nr:SpoIIE family protein phosphatase [Dactylosporangium sp.]NNJ62539.1 SpoIIE family protein phosphatase [Dactylosporangium sp.]